MKIINKFLPASSYTAVNTAKKRICLHHTVSSPLSIDGDVATFAAGRNIATQYIIAGDGTIFQLIPENYWAHHLGMKVANNTQLNQETIGIEIDAWGGLVKNGDQFMNAYGKAIDSKLPVEMIQGGFRGYLHYQEYFPAQIEALHDLLLELSIRHKISFNSSNSLNKSLNFQYIPPTVGNDGGYPSGLYSHTNFRADKSDVYPAKRLGVVHK